MSAKKTILLVAIVFIANIIGLMYIYDKLSPKPAAVQEMAVKSQVTYVSSLPELSRIDVPAPTTIETRVVGGWPSGWFPNDRPTKVGHALVGTNSGMTEIGGTVDLVLKSGESLYVRRNFTPECGAVGFRPFIFLINTPLQGDVWSAIGEPNVIYYDSRYTVSNTIGYSAGDDYHGYISMSPGGGYTQYYKNAPGWKGLDVEPKGVLKRAKYVNGVPVRDEIKIQKPTKPLEWYVGNNYHAPKYYGAVVYTDMIGRESVAKTFTLDAPPSLINAETNTTTGWSGIINFRDPIPWGACSRRVYLGVNPNQLYRQPRPVYLGQDPSTYIYERDLDEQMIELIQYTEGGPVFQPSTECWSYLNQMQYAMYQRNSSMNIDVPVLQQYCPDIYEWSVDYFGSAVYADLGQYPKVVHADKADGVDTIKIRPMAIIQNQNQIIKNVHYESDWANVGICSADYSGGQDFYGNLDRVTVALNYSGPLYHTYGIRVGSRSGSSGGPYYGGHTASERYHNWVTVIASIPLSIGGNQSVNHKWHYTWLYVTNGQRVGGKYYMAMGNSQVNQFKDRLLVDGVARADALISQSSSNNCQVDFIFCDNDAAYYYLVANAGNTASVVWLKSGTLNPWSEWSWAANVPNSRLRLILDIDTTYSGAYSETPNGLQIIRRDQTRMEKYMKDGKPALRQVTDPFFDFYSPRFSDLSKWGVNIFTNDNWQRFAPWSNWVFENISSEGKTFTNTMFTGKSATSTSTVP